MIALSPHRPAPSKEAIPRMIENTELPAAEIAGKALKIASDICVYTNGNIIVETV